MLRFGAISSINVSSVDFWRQEQSPLRVAQNFLTASISRWFWDWWHGYVCIYFQLDASAALTIFRFTGTTAPALFLGPSLWMNQSYMSRWTIVFLVRYCSSVFHNFVHEFIQGFGFLAGKEVKEAAVGNLGLQDRTSYSFLCKMTRWYAFSYRKRSFEMDSEIYSYFWWWPYESNNVGQHPSTCGV